MEPELPPSDGSAASAPPAPAVPLFRRAVDAIAPLLLSLLYLVAFFCAQTLAASVLYSIARAGFLGTLLVHGQPPRGEFYILLDDASAPLMLLVTLLFLRAFHKRRSLASLGLRRPEGTGALLREAWAMPLATIAFLFLYLGALRLLPLGTAVHYRGPSAAAANLRGGPLASLGLLAVLLVAFLVQGGMEELMLRGYVYRICKERWKVWAAIVVSSVLFAALHTGNPGATWIGILNTFLIGVILALLAEATGSLWGPTLAHGVWNFTIACLLSLPVSGIDIFHLLDLTLQGPIAATGGTYGPEGSAVVTVIALAVIALLVPRLAARQRLAEHAAAAGTIGTTASAPMAADNRPAA